MTTNGDPIKLREYLEIHLNKGGILKVAAPQGLHRFIQTEMRENSVIGTSYLRGTGGGSVFYGYYTHAMEEADWGDYCRQQPTEELAGNYYSTTHHDNDRILRERLEAMLEQP